MGGRVGLGVCRDGVIGLRLCGVLVGTFDFGRECGVTGGLCMYIFV